LIDVSKVDEREITAGQKLLRKMAKGLAIEVRITQPVHQADAFDLLRTQPHAGSHWGWNESIQPEVHRKTSSERPWSIILLAIRRIGTVSVELVQGRSRISARQFGDTHMIIVLGSVLAREGRVNEALSLSQEHVARSRAEPGCIAHAVHQDSENPLRLVFIEQWASQEALWQHFKVPASRAFAKELGGLAQEEPRMAIYEATPVQVPGKSAA
jgi:quinol monooxygenase YgiN